MAKAASPVRLQQELMEAAAQAGSRLHRSASEQIEYWADLGRQVARVLDPDVLAEVAAGLARVRIEPVTAEPIDPESVFDVLEQRRVAGTLSSDVTTAPVRYQASSTHPGYLERIDEHGNRTVGQFANGVFTPLIEQGR